MQTIVQNLPIGKTSMVPTWYSTVLQNPFKSFGTEQCKSFRNRCLFSLHMFAMICDANCTWWGKRCLWHDKGRPHGHYLCHAPGTKNGVTVETACQRARHRMGPAGCGDDTPHASSLLSAIVCSLKYETSFRKTELKINICFNKRRTNKRNWRVNFNNFKLHNVATLLSDVW